MFSTYLLFKHLFLESELEAKQLSTSCIQMIHYDA